MTWTRGQSKRQQFDKATYPDVMLDIETLGIRPSSVVLSIGAVRFRMGEGDDVTSVMAPDRCFYARVDDVDQRYIGRTTDKDTLDWWDKQGKEARVVFEQEGEDVATVLRDFAVFCKGCKRIWGNGNTFDNVVVRTLYEDYNQEYPGPYYRDLDMRTVKWVWNFLTDWGSNDNMPKFNIGVKHNALDDARRQVLTIQHMIIESKRSKNEP